MESKIGIEWQLSETHLKMSSANGDHSVHVWTGVFHCLIEYIIDFIFSAAENAINTFYFFQPNNEMTLPASVCLIPFLLTIVNTYILVYSARAQNPVTNTTGVVLGLNGTLPYALEKHDKVATFIALCVRTERWEK